MSFIMWLGISALVGYCADRRGRSGWLWGALSLLFTPLLVGLVLVMLPNLAEIKAAPVENQPSAPSDDTCSGYIGEADEPCCEECDDYYGCEYRDNPSDCPKLWDDDASDDVQEMPGGGTLQYRDSDDAIFPGDRH
ncbi:hypothetical protein [Schwartzia sp. (in: firmicutes)]